MKSTSDNQTKKRSAGRTAVRVILIALAVVLGLALIAFGIFFIKLKHMSRNATSIVEKPTLSPNAAQPAPPPSLIPVENPEDLDLTTDYDPAIDPSDIDEDPIFAVDPYDKDVVNILLLGNDARDQQDHGRSDTMMLLSYNSRTHEAKLVSFLRDTWIYIPGRDKWNRINTAYRFGGIGLAINTINTNFGLDIQYYVRTDFESLVKATDLLGGIDLYLTERETQFINKAASNSVPLEERDGVQHLDGAQTLIHSRNRSIGNGDWSRTERQRNVMNAFLQRAMKEKNIASLASLIYSMFDLVETNLQPSQMISLASDVVFGGGVQLQSRPLPFEGTWQYAKESGMAVIHIDIDENRRLLHEYIYGR